jgi:CRP-like cAMP-binding protein/Fe-S-cluster-containing dehydrogenase component
MVDLTIDGRAVTVPADKTVLDAADILGIPIPVLCHKDGQVPVGVCRMCVVDVGGKVFDAACVRGVQPGLAVKTDTKEVKDARQSLLELLMSDHRSPCGRETCKLEELAGELKTPYLHREVVPGVDDTSHVIRVDHSACILCDRCVRACADAGHFVIARQGKGHDTTIAFDLGKPMGSSDCVSCGECMLSCPTGALTSKVTVAHVIEPRAGCKTQELTARQLLHIDLFSHVPEEFLKLNNHSVVKHTVPPGVTLFREGDEGDTAFYILKGQVRISISDLGHVATSKDKSAPLKMDSSLMDREEHVREHENLKRKHVPVDAHQELPYENPSATLDEGHLFGEMSCLSFYLRSVTAITLTECEILEMRRNVLDMVQRNKQLRAKIQSDYCAEGLLIHLRAIFPSMTPDFVNDLRSKVELKRYAPGEIIYYQGDPADAFYLVRIGCVKVSANYSGRDVVLAYLSKGSHFGEKSILHNRQRSATCSAQDNVDLVRIAAEDFREIVKSFPEIQDALSGEIQAHDAENEALLLQASYDPADDLGEFLRQGLHGAQSLLVLDLDKCTRCDQCVTACADAHDGTTRLIRDGLRYDHYLIATSCRHCQDPLCMVGCPVSAIHRPRSLEVIIEDWCIGCGLCAKNCPYGNINMHTFSLAGDELQALGVGQEQARKARLVRKATNCNLCHGQDEPSCVAACPHDAAHRYQASDFRAKLTLEKTDR